MAFITDEFLLQSQTARRLYHECAAPLPILDFHNHLSPQAIAEDRRYENIAQLWLDGDHYKWRLMRANAIPERFCTGEATDREKFVQWAATMPNLLRNPQYHWTHLELHRIFGIDDLLGPDTADAIWSKTAEMLATPAYSTRGLLRRFNVEALCTTDDPADDLKFHEQITHDTACKTRVFPTFRADNSFAIDDAEHFKAWVDGLERAADVEIRDFDTYLSVLDERHAFFHGHGCRLADQSIRRFYTAAGTRAKTGDVFSRARAGKRISVVEAGHFKSRMLFELARMNHKRGWVQQYHFGPLRDLNSRAFTELGRDTGFDSMGDAPIAQDLGRFLDTLHREDRLAKTIVYVINPKDLEVVATMLANFQDGATPGKMQLGAAWWHLDQRDGIERHIEVVSNMGILRRFAGMVTDSRSFLSMSRHEYFRRILCNVLGNDVESGLLPNDTCLLGDLITDVCYQNARDYLGLSIP